jgi:hypothetical protein
MEFIQAKVSIKAKKKSVPENRIVPHKADVITAGI